MSVPFVVAQAGSASASAGPVQVIKITKPPAGRTEIFHASFSGVVKIDFTAIANEKITFFHDSKNQSLHIIFADGSQAIIEPFFDSMGVVFSNLTFEVGPGQILDSVQFAGQFPITTDQAVLPAAGDTGDPLSGGDFHDPTVDPLGLPEPLPLLPPEELPPIKFTDTVPAVFGGGEEQVGSLTPPIVVGHVFGVVEEEQLNQESIEQPSLAGQGNEDTHDITGNSTPGSGLDTDISDTGPGSLIITQTTNGSLASIVTGGVLPITFLANIAADGTVVRDSLGNEVKSINETVQYHFVDVNNIEGWTLFGSPDARLIFTLHAETNGLFTFTLNDQIDHQYFHSHDDGTALKGILEETLNLDLSTAITAHDAAFNLVVFPANSFDIGVIDDTPVAFDTTPSALDDEDQSSGIQNGPGDDGLGTSVSGVLNFSPGADNYGSVAFGTGITVSASDGVHTTSISQLQAIFVDGSGVGHKENVTLHWTPDGLGGGTLTGTSTNIPTVFTLTVDKFGAYTFTANAPFAHPFTQDPSDPSSHAFEDNLNIVFTCTVTDFDGDQVDAHLTINIDDDVPRAASLVAATGVVHDETPGVQTSADPNASNDVTSSDLPPAIKALFDNIGAARGNDTDVASKDDSAIGFAAASGSLALASGGAFGADGSAVSGGQIYSLAAVDGTFSGIQTTDGFNIYLYNGSGPTAGLILGRVGNDSDALADDPNAAGNVAFALAVDSTSGIGYIAQYLSLRHPDQANSGNGFNSYDEQISLLSGSVQLTVTLTDDDGDKAASQAINVGQLFAFQDDGPSLNIVDSPNSVNETQTINGTWTLTEGADGVTGVDITVGATTLTLSIPSGILGADPIQHVTFGPGDGAFGTLNVYSDGTWTYTAGNVSGDQSFSFTIKAVDGDGDTASDLQTITVHDNNQTLTQNSPFSGTVEEEQLGHVASPTYASSFVGNEDESAGPPDNDLDVSPNFNITTNIALGSYGVSGGTGPYTFHFAGGLEGTQAQWTDAPISMTSHGDPVLLHVDGNTLFGYTEAGNGPGYTEGVDHVVFTFQITDTATGQATFTLYDNLDHHTVATADNLEGTRSLNLNGIVEITDSSPSPQTLSLNGSVGIIDDIPVAANDNATVEDGGMVSTNFLLVFDTSSSMLDDPGVPGFTTRLDLEIIAALNLLNSTNVNEVFIVGFSDNAYDSGGWLNKSQAIFFINFLTAGGFTNYDAALADAETAFTFAHTGADRTLAYFLSDGEPNRPIGSEGINASEQATWESFLTTNGVAQSIAVGVGSGVTTAALEPIAFPNGDPDNPIVLTDESQLSATLIGSLPGTVTGNVLSNDSFGADGPGANAGIVSFAVDGHTYAYVAGGNFITKDNIPFVSGSALDLNTALGGHLVFHFATGGGFTAGDWEYHSPANLNATTTETFHYFIADGDGDQTSADLNVTVTAVNDAPIANEDTILTNIAGSGAAVVIPDQALLLNDTDVDGPTLSVSSVGPASSGTVVHALATTTFTDDDASGGLFGYSVQDGGIPNLTASSGATINRLQAGEDQLDGTSFREILIGRPAANDTLVGGGGRDILIGDTGADHFLYASTSDGGTIANQAGADHILDFNTGEGDSIDILVSAFNTGGLVVGTDATAPGMFGSSANDNFGSGAERFHFNSATHTLLYDSNGNAAGGTQVALAVLENGGTVDAAHIHMV